MTEPLLDVLSFSFFMSPPRRPKGPLCSPARLLLNFFCIYFIYFFKQEVLDEVNQEYALSSLQTHTVCMYRGTTKKKKEKPVKT